MSAELRYSRQIGLAQWGEAGQQRLAGATVMIVGLGGLGVPAATYLATTGVGHLLLNDFDTVDVTNLPRQPLYTPDDVGQSKCRVAAEALERLNTGCRISMLDTRLDAAGLLDAIAGCDVVVDASDNFSTRFRVNEYCVRAGKPLVSGAAIRFEAQLTVFRADLAAGPCYRCLYDESGDDLEDCRGQGVAAPLTGIVGCLMALETIRVLVGFGAPAHGRVHLYDALTGRWRAVVLAQDPSCPVCG